MSTLSDFLSPYIERVEVNAIIGPVVSNRLKQDIRLYIGHSKDVEILTKGHTFDMPNFKQVSALNDAVFSFEYMTFTEVEDSLSEPCYDTLLLLEDNGLDDVVLGHYKLKENTLENLVGYFFI